MNIKKIYRKKTTALTFTTALVMSGGIQAFAAEKKTVGILTKKLWNFPYYTL
ncbi:hypothetical protein GCM10020331_006700 [Ectobacillus funiculus]